MTDLHRLRKLLASNLSPAIWPAGVAPIRLDQTDPRLLHAILVEAYRDGFGSVPPLDDWWPALTADTEFDPNLVFIAADATRRPIGLAQCWTSGFIKDFAVVPAWRGKGIGEALLHAVFAAFRQCGLDHVDLKVVAANTPAIGLYRRVGMVNAPL